ncbi:glycoside hydrolase family 53 protein [Pseudonocardia saturnea]
MPRPTLGPPRALPPLTTFRGADLSFTLALESAGLTFTDQQRTAPVETLLAARGANLVRLRVWVNPGPGSNDLRTALFLGRRANAAGCHIMLSLHCSDTWADPFNQETPAAWVGQDVLQLAETLRSYTREVLAAFAAQGTPPAIVQVGNELSNGMLWPVGRLGPEQDAGFDNLAILLRAGLAGVREGAAQPVQTMIHTDTGGGRQSSIDLFYGLRVREVEFDVAGFSFFPWWHGETDALAATLEAVAGRFEIPVAVVETAYPWMVPADAKAPLHVASAARLPEAERFPPTPRGQADFLAAVRASVEDVPGGRGLGFVVWEPAWRPEVKPNPGDVNRFANLTMFDWTGAGLPSLNVFAP